MNTVFILIPFNSMTNISIHNYLKFKAFTSFLARIQVVSIKRVLACSPLHKKTHFQWVFLCNKYTIYLIFRYIIFNLAFGKAW